LYAAGIPIQVYARLAARARAACAQLTCAAPRTQTRHLTHAINEATEAIPGWDEYVATGKATQLWDGNVAAKPR